MTDVLDELRSRRCVACEGGVEKLDAVGIARLGAALPDWRVADDRLHRRFVFSSFPAAIRFVDRMAELAEGEGHHPDFAVHYRQVDVTIWTHAIGGLSENDFVLAAKIDML